MSRFRGSPAFDLPKTVVGRCALAVACLVLLPLAAFGLGFLIFVVPLPQTILGWVFRIVIESLFLGLLFFSLFGLVWAVARPAWAERLLQAGAFKLLLALCAFCLISMPFAIWAIWNA
jgi:hypothetical protein